MFAAPFRAFHLVAALAVGLALSACARTGRRRLNGAYGAAAYRSVQEFAASVGDRVFFDTDATELSSTAQATLDKQAAWLNQYPRYTFTIEGHADERGTREYNFALGLGAPDDQELPDRQGRRGLAHEDDQLRQRAPGGGVQ